MSNNAIPVLGKRWIVAKRSASIALTIATLILGGYSPQVWATSAPFQISQRQQHWDAVLRTARMVNENGAETALVLQLDVLDKPETSYANAVYQVFARLNGRWTEIYTNIGARLIASPSGHVTLPPEVVLLNDLERQIGQTVNWSNVELRSVVKVRYDIRGGQRNQEHTWELTEAYNAIAYTTNSEMANGRVIVTQPAAQTSNGTLVTTVTSQQPVTTARTQTLNPGHFSLAIRQSHVTYPDVIARISLKPKRGDRFLEERCIGDFRYRMNERATFIQGLEAGDRVAVRLFSPQHRLIGYSEFELLSNFAAVNLILPNQVINSDDERVIRTVYGIDANQNGDIDSSSRVYDFFTRLIGSNYQTTRVTFLPSTQGIDARLFAVRGLPEPPSTCAYTNSFINGSFSLVSRTFSIFRSALAPALVALPGQVVQTTNISTNSVSTYEVNRLITAHERVGISEGAIVVIENDGEFGYDYEYDDDEYEYDDDDDDDNGVGRRHCNQGIGNGPEG